MRAEHAGFGSYTYECRKQDCWHCANFGLIPLPELYVPKHSGNKPMLIVKSRQRKWSMHEMDVVRNNQHLTIKKLQRKLPNRSLLSIHVKVMRMIRKGVL